jgi:hypothetical protein
VQSNETNQLDRFLFARESMFSTKNSAKENLLMPKKWAARLNLAAARPWVFLKELQCC